MPGKHMVIGQVCARDTRTMYALQRFENSSGEVSQRLKLTDVEGPGIDVMSRHHKYQVTDNHDRINNHLPA
ncbi:hypothetical protein ACNKHL_13920 [Shigella flexneri]